MAVMLRVLNIPSRVVTGFQSGIYNPISGYQLIRTSDAHSWVEAWLPDRGWTTFDPTPPDPNPPRISLWTRLGFYADAAEVFWNDWVLNYDLDRQLQLASRMGETSRHVGSRWFEGRPFSLSSSRGRDDRRLRAAGSCRAGADAASVRPRRMALVGCAPASAESAARRGAGFRCHDVVSADAEGVDPARYRKAGLADTLRIRARRAGAGSCVAGRGFDRGV